VFVSTKSRIAIALLSILLMYYEVYRWIPLRRWNWQFHWPVQNDQFYPDIVIGFLLALFIFTFLRSWRPGMWVAVALLGLWGCAHFLDWWLPYMQSAASLYPRFRFYAQRTQLLPVVGNHYPPDGGHAVLDFLLYPAFLACFTAAASRRKT
jgi:hypothetical protein